MIESTSRIIRLLQGRKAFTLPILYLLFALLIFFSSAGVFIGDIGTNHGYSASGNKCYLLAQNFNLTIPALIIPLTVTPNSDGEIVTGTNTTPGNAVDLVQKAYAAGEPTLNSVVRRQPASLSLSSENSAVRLGFVRNLVTFMLTWGADIHLNWGPLASFLEPKFLSIMTDFRSAFDTISPKPMLTTAATWGILTVRPAADLLHTREKHSPMMTYEISAPWPGCIIDRDASSL
jgi:hypothetical protein